MLKETGPKTPGVRSGLFEAWLALTAQGIPSQWRQSWARAQ